MTAMTLHILLALADGEKHGYAIMQEVAERTGGRVRLGPGTLYGAVQRLLEEGLIEELAGRAAGEADDERRRYYRLTREGRKAAAGEAARLEEIVRIARSKGVLRHA